MPKTLGRIGLFIAAGLRGIRRWSNRLCEWFLPGRLSSKRKKRWESWWSDDDYQPFFEPDNQIPPEIDEAIHEEWFPPNTRLLDIGCGSGWIAGWLADQGFDVLGVDYAEGAIERARERFRDHNGNLKWKVADIIEGGPPDTDFDVLIDRGCLHRIPDANWPKYCRNVHASAKPGAKFLLMVATFNHERFVLNEARMSHEDLKKKVSGVFAGHFEIERMTHGFIQLNERMGEDMPAVTFWMTVRSKHQLESDSSQSV
jgi:2-polyprenyl-3-methyl-5-hydroxy-6-metoxy-1,4-benzoquinol methylase